MAFMAWFSSAKSHKLHSALFRTLDSLALAFALEVIIWPSNIILRCVSSKIIPFLLARWRLKVTLADSSYHSGWIVHASSYYAAFVSHSIIQSKSPAYSIDRDYPYHSIHHRYGCPYGYGWIPSSCFFVWFGCLFDCDADIQDYSWTSSWFESEEDSAPNIVIWML